MNAIKKALLFVSITTAAASLAGTGDAQASCVAPAANEITLHQHANYGGWCASFIDLAVYRPYGLNASDAYFYFSNDAISSLKTGAANGLTVYQHTNGGGDSQEFGPGSRASTLGWWNDRISSMIAW